MSQVRLDLLHAHWFVLQFEHPQKEPSIIDKEEFLMTVNCDSELSGIPEGLRNMLEEHRSNWFLVQVVLNVPFFVPTVYRSSETSAITPNTFY